MALIALIIFIAYRTRTSISIPYFAI